MSKHFEQVSRVIANDVSFTWKIQDFSRLYDVDNEFETESKEFGSSGSYWRLSMSPKRSDYHKTLPNNKGTYIVVKLVDVSEECVDTGISRVRIGFKTKTDGAEEFYMEKEGDEILESVKWIKYVKQQQCSFCVWVGRHELFMMDSELLPGDVLTVFCNIEYVTMMHENLNEESSVLGEDIYLKQGSVTLSKNIENMFENSRLSDTTLKVDGDSFQAHRAVLASRSKVFEAMFESGMKEGQENEVNMVEMKSATAMEMLQYIYAGKIEKLSMDRALDLYVAADRYDLQELKGWCKDFILKHISADDVCKVAVMADLHRDEELTTVAKRIFKQNSKTLLLSEAWKNLVRENLSVYVDLTESALLSES